jgi:DNA-binding transcriptional regulator YiaG
LNRRAVVEWRNRWATAIHHARTSVMHMTQHQLAAHLGTSQATVACWETGANVPSDLMKVRLLALTGLDAAVLFRPLDADPISEVAR